MNILDYLGTEFASFEEKPFNPVDSAALSQFCMVRAEGIVPPLRERKAFGGLAGALEHGGRQHRLPVLGELGGVPDAACGKRTCDGRQVALFMEASRGLKIEFTVEDAGHCTAPS